ncbi:uncharacterized protein [Rutidosis leptorrhynchoides]|uniref:uncharacterized protein n=1 Tax=Rutidosis leptorrhynchoides TaxID=125765 RepID=UPI003A99D938
MQGTLDKFVKRKASIEGEPSSANVSNKIPISNSIPSLPKEIDITNLPWDPADRKNILYYDPNQRDEIRRLYLQRGPFQPRGHVCPAKKNKQCGSDAFVTDGFCNWNKKNRFSVHKDDVNSFHNRARLKCEDLMKPKQSIAVALNKQSGIEKQEYRIRLQSSIDVVRYVMHNTLPFRGHDESENSIYRGIFLETLKLVASQNDDARKAMIKAPKNCKLTSPDIQKDTVE